jgi:hypothetical protein
VRFCPACGNPVEADKRFCTSCGSPVQPPGAAPPQPEPASAPQESRTGLPALNRQKMITLAAVAGILVVVALGVLVLLPSPSGYGTPASPAPPPGTVRATATPGETFAIPKATENIAVPVSGVWVHISYLGGWRATYGMAGLMQTMENSGEHYYAIPNATGKIDLTAGKLDGSATHALVAEIVKDGRVLANRSTSLPWGNVTVSADTGTASKIPGQPGAVPLTPTLTGRIPGPVTKAPVCPSDRIACNGTCTDIRTDNSSCGSCQNSCPAGKYCSNGNCVLTCSPEQASCPDGCSNLMTDPRHCGSCSTSCPFGLICTAGRCDSPATPMPVPQ